VHGAEEEERGFDSLGRKKLVASGEEGVRVKGGGEEEEGGGGGAGEGRRGGR
jgi:hypothetical protein